MSSHRSLEPRMAVLFALALALIVWQALRTKPALQPPFEIATEVGERLAPVAVPSWRSPIALPVAPAERLALLTDRAVDWPAETAPEAPQQGRCRLFVRISSQHWALRAASREQLRAWVQGDLPGGPWWQLHLPAVSFADDDDGDGDLLDAGELAVAGPGAEVEVFC